MIYIPSIDNLKEIINRIKLLIPTKVSQLQNDKGYKTTDTTYETGTSNISGITKLYSEKGENTDGTITQQVLSSIFTEMENDIEDLKDKDIDGGQAFSVAEDYKNDYDGGDANRQQ